MKQLLILHGALGSKSQFFELTKLLSANFEVYCMEFEGHGSDPDNIRDFSIERFAEQTHATLRALGWEQPMVFGYSMGGYVALKLESMHPQMFSRIITLGTKFNWTPESAQQESRMLNPEKIAEKVPAFAYALAQLHGETYWRHIVERTAKMMVKMGANPPLTEDSLKKISVPVMCLLGEKDAMVSEEETQWAVNSLGNATYHQVAEWPHPIEKIPAEELHQVLTSRLN